MMRATKTLGERIGSPAARVVLLLIGLLVAVLFLWRLATHSSAPLPAGTRVLLVTIDTLRPDALGFVAGQNETPNIDALAYAGVRFAGAISQVPLTLPSHTTIMTGVYPVRHGIHVNGQLLGDRVPTLAEQFRAHGYATAAFVSATVLNKDFGLSRGFDVYDDSGNLGDSLLQRHAPQTFAAAIKWIGEQGDRPWFLWVHVYDAHAPYQPPRTFWKPGSRGAYDGAVSFIDDSLNAMLEAARVAAPSNLLTVLAADHAEAFGEHGEIYHGNFIYDTTMRVPLIFNYPEVLKPAAPTFIPRLVDISPTLVAGFGWTPPLVYDGINLMPGLLGQRLEVPSGYMETESPWTSFGWASLYGVNSGNWKLIDAPTPELYHLAEDAGESTNRHGTDLDQAARLTQELDRVRLETPIERAGRIDDAQILTKLQSLGYVGAGGETGTAPKGSRDPKDGIRILDLFREAESASKKRDTEAAFELYNAILEQDPKNKHALSRSGSLALELGNLPVAIERLAAALENFTDQSDAQFALADALTRAKRYTDALPHWLETVRLQPNKIEAWSNLGSVAMWIGDTTRGIDAYEQALKLAPDNPALQGNLGEALRRAGRKPEALELLVRAAQKEGGLTQRASQIGLLYAELGNKQEAAGWLSRAHPDEEAYIPGQVQRIVYLSQSDKQSARALAAAECKSNPSMADLVRATPELQSIADACFSVNH